MNSTPFVSARALAVSASTAASTIRISRLSHVRDAALVHLIEQRCVLLLDDLALDLEARRQLAFIDRQVLRQDRELLDALVLRERLVDLREIRIEQLLRLGRTHD